MVDVFQHWIKVWKIQNSSFTQILREINQFWGFYLEVKIAISEALGFWIYDEFLQFCDG